MVKHLSVFFLLVLLMCLVVIKIDINIQKWRALTFFVK